MVYLSQLIKQCQDDIGFFVSLLGWHPQFLINHCLKRYQKRFDQLTFDELCDFLDFLKSEHKQEVFKS